MDQAEADKNIAQAKAEGRKLAMLTAYDYSTAKLEDEAGIDGILIGDSLGNVCSVTRTPCP